MKNFSKITLSLSALILAIFLAACSTEADSTNTKTESYVITFNPNGGSIITKKQTIEGNKEANIASASALGLSYNSMKFLGWALTSSANEAVYGDGAKIILSENITLYAVWKDTSPKITLSTSKDSVYKGENIELSVGFENFTEIPSSLDVYKSNSESIATGVSVTDGKISFSSAGFDSGAHSLFVQAGNTKSNTASITIIEKAIQITAVSENVFSGVLSGAVIELSVSFENFIENPGTLDVYESNQSEPLATGVSVTDGKISFSSAGFDSGAHSLFVQAGNTKSNTISVTILAKKIQITAVSENVLSGATVELSVSFENFIENPGTLDVYESNQSEPVATGVSVTDGKISFSSAGFDSGAHSLFVQAGNTKSNTKSVTILAKKIQITAVSENVLSGTAIELSVSFENFIETPGTLDVYESNKSEPVATGVSVTDGKISFSSMSLDAGTYNFYIKTNGISSNIINIQIVKKEIKLNSTDTSVFVGNTIDIPIEFLNYTEEPTSVDVYKNDESLPFLTNISVSDNKISIPLSLDLENASIYVKADSENSNALSIGAVGLLNQDGSYSVSISSLNKVAGTFSGGNYSFKVIGGCTSENLKNSIEKDIFNKLDSWALDLSKVTGLTKIDGDQYSVYNGTGTFSGCSSLTSIVLPDTVTALGDEAFCDCSSLTSIKLPDNLNTLGAGVFSRCSNLIDINIPNSLTYIPYETFKHCTNLTNIDLPETVIKIYEDAFFGTNLKSIELPKKLTYLGFGAFGNCKALTSIEIPETVTSIESGVFSECWNLSNITIPNTVTSIGAHAFYRCKIIKSINIPEGVSSIGYGAFMLCSALESITIPNKVTSIEYNTFYGCTSLSNVSIPDGVEEIDKFAFYGCTSLSNISIPGGVRFIGDSAFNGCSSLTSITIPDAVTYFYSSAFDNCTNLTKAIFQNTENWYRSGLSGEVPVDKLDLADEEKAAELLKESNYYWTNHY